MNSVTIDKILAAPEFMLFRLDFQADEAVFCQIPPALPNHACVSARQCPSIRAPLGLALNAACAHEAGPFPPLHFIWITDFCGSTLFARALNEVQGLYLYNEPRIFYNLAEARRYIDAGLVNYPLDRWHAVLRFALKQQAKVFNAGDISLVKEWPQSNYILHHMLNASSDYRGVFLHATLKDYLVKALKSETRRKLARDRVSKFFIDIGRMESFAGVDIACLSDPQAVALHWLYLMYLH